MSVDGAPDGRVTGTVTRIETYGLYVDTPHGPAVVLIVDVSSKRIRNLRTAYEVGQTVQVRLLQHMPEWGMYKATMIDVAGSPPR